MELWQAVGNLSPGVAVGVVCLYLYNTMAMRYLEERMQMWQQVITERKEWTDALKVLNQQYVDLLRSAVEAMTKLQSENHALRGRIQEFITNVEVRYTAIAEQLRATLEAVKATHESVKNNRIRGTGNE